MNVGGKGGLPNPSLKLIRQVFIMEMMEKCSACKGQGFTVNTKHYNLEAGFSVKRKSIKKCSECNGIGFIVNGQKDDQGTIKAH